MTDLIAPVGGDQVLSGEIVPNKGFIDQEQFLQLLVAQLKNQDPLSPMESQEFASQMAQFASLERLHSIDSRLGDALNAQLMSTQAITNTMAASLIGKEVVAAGDSLVLKNGSANLHFDLAGPAKDVEITIYDQGGTLIQTIWRRNLAVGENTVVWDGSENSGDTASDGSYTYTVQATDKDGNPITALQTASGIITGVNYVGGVATLIAGDLEFPMGNVISIRQPE